MGDEGCKMMNEIPYLPTAFVARLDNGRIVVLHGQASDMATSPDADPEDVPWSLEPTYSVPPARGYRTAVRWHQSFQADYSFRADLQPENGGVALHVDRDGKWSAAPLAVRTVDELIRLQTRVEELEDAARVVLDSVEAADFPTYVNGAEELRAAVDGTAEPT